MLNPQALLAHILKKRQLYYEQMRYGPFVLVYGPEYDSLMYRDYARWGTVSLYDRLRQIDGIAEVRRQEASGITLQELVGPFTVFCGSQNPF